MTDQHGLTQVTEMQGVTRIARDCITNLIYEMTGSEEIAFDFYREWSGGWRVGVDVTGPISGHMDFVLFHTPAGGILAIPPKLPDAWRTRRGVQASDGSRWTVDDAGMFVPFVPDGS
jgi:hypothetical protein